MKHTCEIIIQAPLNHVFLAAADVARWPEFLPHYRYNRFLEQSPSGGIIKTSSMVAGINTNWISKYQIDTKAHQLRFHHIQSTMSLIVGMKVVWDFATTSEGDIAVTVTHTLNKQLPVLGKAAALLIKGFAQDNAMRSLTGLKRKVEMQLLINS